MKSQIYLIVLSLSTILYSCGGPSPAKQTTGKTDLSKNKIEVIYFHAEHRCRACLDIEKFTRYTLNTYFQKELNDSTITFQTYNVDKEENYPVSEEYEAFGSALFLNVIHNGTSKKINLTDFAFLNSSDMEKFIRDLKNEIDNELKHL